jgi:uncharacterized membrane protein YfhO
VFNKRIINNRHTLNFCEAMGLFAAVYVTLYLLSQDNVFPMSINSAWVCFNRWAHHFHLIAVALLPVYVALMVFGTATIGIYLGSAIQRWMKVFFVR